MPYGGSIYALEHIITAGSQFTGELPTTTPVEANGVYKYPTSTKGGLFGLPGLPDLVEVSQVVIKFGGQTGWTLGIYDPDDSFEYPIASGTTEARLLWTYEQKLIVPQGRYLRLITVGATTAMRALVKVERGFANRIQLSQI